MDHAILETSSDRYVIQEYLAEGGMGAIYLGKKIGAGGFEKQVVLKQLLPEFTSEPQFIDLFLREARISASLDHANIVHTIDLVAAGKDFFIVMEYVRGGDLRTLMRRGKRRGRHLSPAAALYVGHEIADALAYAHAKTKPNGRPLALIHRDVSPSNILLSGSGSVKLTDFGIAKASTHRSVFYRVKGKVGYMSPEQARGEPIDHRSDLYSLAVCLYEALVGERLFIADLTSTPAMIYSQPVPRVSLQRPGLPDELDAIVHKALAIKADDRFQTAGELQEAVRRVAYRNGLMYSSQEMGAHLLEVLGPDVSQWLRGGDVGDERGGGTELYENSQVEEPAPAREESDWDEAPRSRSGVALSEGTQLTSILRMQRYADAIAAGATPAPAEADSTRRQKLAAKAPPSISKSGAARGAWETEETRHYPDGKPPVSDPGDERDDRGRVDGEWDEAPSALQTQPGAPALPSVEVPLAELHAAGASHAAHASPVAREDDDLDSEEPTRVADEDRHRRPRVRTPLPDLVPEAGSGLSAAPLLSIAGGGAPARHPDDETAPAAQPLHRAPPSGALAPVAASSGDATRVTPPRRRGDARMVNTEVMKKRRPSWRSRSQLVLRGRLLRNAIVGALVLVLVAAAVALAVALSDPGADPGDLPGTPSSLEAPR